MPVISPCVLLENNTQKLVNQSAILVTIHYFYGGAGQRKRDGSSKFRNEEGGH